MPGSIVVIEDVDCAIDGRSFTRQAAASPATGASGGDDGGTPSAGAVGAASATPPQMVGHLTFAGVWSRVGGHWGGGGCTASFGHHHLPPGSPLS